MGLVSREDPEPEGIPVPGSELSVLALVCLPLIEVSHAGLDAWGSKPKKSDSVENRGEEALGALNAANLRLAAGSMLVDSLSVSTGLNG